MNYYALKCGFASRKLKLPKAGWVKYRDARVFDDQIKNVTVSRTKSGRYFASILIEKEIDVQEKTTIQESKIAAFDMKTGKSIHHLN